MRDQREWLEADGLGGFAMGSADGIARRRYHGLLVSALRPPVNRMVLVNGLEVFAETGAGRVALSSHRYGDAMVFPDGAERIASFDHAPWPRWTFELPGGVRIAQEVVVAKGAPRTLVRFSQLAGPSAKLWARPLLSGRDYHALHHENPWFRFEAEVHGERVTWRPYMGVPAIGLVANGAYEHAPEWYRDFAYDTERERGLDFAEDLASPGILRFDLGAAPAVLVFAKDGEGLATGAADLAERLCRDELARRARFPSPLHLAADAYLVKRGGGLTVIAGYPWFTDWGRDTFISLRGLCLAAGRPDDARRILLEWADLVSQGMLPNFFADAGAAEFNSVDASLWFVVAADAVCAVKGLCSAADRARLERAVLAIVTGYHGGTRHGIRADGDGLLACGQPGVQLTWMDAKVDAWVVTPRTGKPVEVQALWANALAIAARLERRWEGALARVREAFPRRFWNADRRMLYDVVDCDHAPGTADPTFRPNQLFAVGGLPLALLDGERARAVVDACEAALWTPAGVRTLAPGERGYAPRYTGDRRARDGAYHQGTVWPWLAGAMAEAWLRVRGDSPEHRAEARRRFLAPLVERTEACGLGHLFEIADAEPPFTPRGTPFQAWSVAEALRLDALLG